MRNTKNGVFFNAKKMLSIFVIVFLMLNFLGSCSKNDIIEDEVESNETENLVDEPESLSQENKKLVYTTFFPVYDLSKRIIGDKMEIRNIIEATAQPHGFELSAAEIEEISKADLIIYNGANMEEFIGGLKSVIKDENKFLDLSQGLTLLSSSQNMEDENSMDNVNPHTWLSIKNAMEELDTIYRKVSSIEPENEEYFKKNLEGNLSEFEDLERNFAERLAKIEGEKYFVVSHAAFNYLASDYGLKQVAVTGISPDQEPSAMQLQKIAEFVRDKNIKTIFFEGKATPKVAETLANETGAKTDTIYTMENLTEEEVKLGYLKLMELNLKALERAFNE